MRNWRIAVVLMGVALGPTLLSSKMSLARALTTADQLATAVSDHSASGRGSSSKFPVVSAPRSSIPAWRRRGGFAQVGNISTSRRKRRSGPAFVPEPCTSELSNITISPGWSAKSTACDSSNASVMYCPFARMLRGSSLSS